MATVIVGWGLTPRGYVEALRLTLTGDASERAGAANAVSVLHAAGYTGAAIQVIRDFGPEVFYGPLPVGFEEPAL